MNFHALLLSMMLLFCFSGWNFATEPSWSNAAPVISFSVLLYCIAIFCELHSAMRLSQKRLHDLEVELQKILLDNLIK